MRFAEGLEQTMAWYRENAWWWSPVRSGEYRDAPNYSPSCCSPAPSRYVPARVAAVALGDEERPTEIAGQIAPDVLAGSHAGTPCVLIPDSDGAGRAQLTVRTLTGHQAAIGPTVETRFAARSFTWAKQTMALANAGSYPPNGQPLHATSHLAELGLTSDIALLETLIEHRLAPLETLTENARARLCETLLAWLENECSAPAAARALNMHPQTIRYRLTQLRGLLGDALDTPRAQFELQLALHGRLLTSRAPDPPRRT